MTELSPERGLFAISVVTELTGVQPQALRDYEAKGLLTPRRTAGGTRRYSSADVARIERVIALLATGLNLEGVRQVLDLEAETRRLRAEIERLHAAHDGDPTATTRPER